jgi:hypothetical protein
VCVVRTGGFLDGGVTGMKIQLLSSDRYYQVILERIIELGLVELDVADIYADGEVWVDMPVLRYEINRAVIHYSTPELNVDMKNSWVPHEIKKAHQS